MMKKETIIMAFAMGLSLFVSSCNDSEENGIDDARGELVPVVFDSPSINMITRATETDFENGDAMSITAVNRTISGSEMIGSDNYANNVKYVCDGDKFTAGYKPIYQYKKNPYDLVYYAVYPYQESGTSQFTFNVIANQNSHSRYSMCDLSMQKIASKEQSINLSLKHMLCNVEIIITGTNLNTKNISHGRLINMYHTVTADQNAQTVTTDFDSAKRYAEIYGNVTKNTDTEYRFSAIVAPQTIEANRHFVTVEVNNMDVELKTAATANPITLNSGRKYVFACNLDGNAVGSNLYLGYGGVDDNGDQIPAARMVSTSEWE